VAEAGTGSRQDPEVEVPGVHGLTLQRLKVADIAIKSANIGKRAVPQIDVFDSFPGNTGHDDACGRNEDPG